MGKFREFLEGKKKGNFPLGSLGQRMGNPSFVK
jgi:hypothetical protein